jgi:hypothetical protein
MNEITQSRRHTARRESFLPGIQATACVSAGCIQKNTEAMKDGSLLNPSRRNVKKRRQQLAQCKKISIRWNPNGIGPLSCALRMKDIVRRGR